MESGAGAMFSSGSECSPRNERRSLVRGTSGLASSMGEVFESSGGAANPVLSPVLPTFSSGLGDAILLVEPEPQRGSPSAAEGELVEVQKVVPGAEARGRATGGGGGGSGSGLENAGRGAHMGQKGGRRQKQANGLPQLPAGLDEGGEPLQGGGGGGPAGGSSRSSSSDSRNGRRSITPPAGRQRRGRPLGEEARPEASKKGSKSNKRRHAPTPGRRRGARGTLPTGEEEEEEEAAADGEEENQQLQDGDNYGSQGSSDYSGSDRGSDSGPAAAAGVEGIVVAAVLPPPPPAPAPPAPAPEAPDDYAGAELLSEFDSNTTWAGASAYSHATTRTGLGSVLETSSALSQYPSSYLSTTAAKLDSAAVWKQQPLGGRNGELNGVVSISTASTRRSRGRASPPHAIRVPTGTPARRGVRKGAGGKLLDRMSTAAAAGGGGGGAEDSSTKPRSLTRPTSIRGGRAAMSPHGVAMDAAMRIVEEQGARLGIVREEREDTAAGGGKGGGGKGEGAKDAAYANQIAAPAMTSLEQRRQRAKAWAKSR